VTILNWFGAIVSDILVYILDQQDRFLVSTVMQKGECIEHRVGHGSIFADPIQSNP